MTAKHLLGMALLFCLSSHTIAQTCTSLPSGTGMQSLCGSRHAGPGAVNASSSSFGAGLTRDNGATYTNTATVSESVKIVGEVRPEAADVGLTADIFVVDRISGTANFTMKTQAGVWVPWNGSVSLLVPFIEDQVLTSTVAVDMFTGTLGTANEHRFFLGYLPAGGVLRYHTSGLPVIITAQATQTPMEQAQALFASKISPNIVGICVSCHAPGGVASHLHNFTGGSSTTELNADFQVFRTLLTNFGKTGLQNKIGASNTTHTGGQIIFPGTQTYTDFDLFLSLLLQI